MNILKLNSKFNENNIDLNLFEIFLKKNRELQSKIHNNDKITDKDKNEYNKLLKNCKNKCIYDNFFNIKLDYRSIVFNQELPIINNELEDDNNFDLNAFLLNFNTLGLDKIHEKETSIIFSATYDYVTQLFISQYKYYSNNLTHFKIYLVTPTKKDYELISDFIRINNIYNTHVIMLEFRNNNMSLISMVMSIRFYFLTYLLINKLSKKIILSDLDVSPFLKSLDYLDDYQSVNLICYDAEYCNSSLRILSGGFSGYKLNENNIYLMKIYCKIHESIINKYSINNERNLCIDQITLGDLFFIEYIKFNKINRKYILFKYYNIKAFNGTIEERGHKLKKYIEKML